MRLRALAILVTVPALAAADPDPDRGRPAERRAPDGSWPIEGGDDALGSPASYGRPLATLTARNTLRAADPAAFREAVDRADRWLAARPLSSTLDAAVALLTGAGNPGALP